MLFYKGQNRSFQFGRLFQKPHKTVNSKETQRPKETSFAYLITRERAETSAKAFQLRCFSQLLSKVCM